MKKNYLFGILGAFLGGLIATIPWILLYVYANMMSSFLAIFVAIGALKGYELFKGEVTKKLPIIITIISIISISLATLVIAPPLLLLKESVSVSMQNLHLLYTDDIFIAGMIRDYIITIIFTFLGISGVISSIKKQIQENKATDKIKVNLSTGNVKKDIEKIKNYFITNNAITEESAISIENSGINIDILNMLVTQKIIIKTIDKYYYVEETEKKLKRRNAIVTAIIIIIIFALIGLGTIINSKDSDKKDLLEEANDKLSTIKDVLFSIPNAYKEYPNEDEENSWYYVPKNDISGESGYINVCYFDSEIQYSDGLIDNIKTELETYEGVIDVEFSSSFKNNFGYNVILYNITYNDFVWQLYYIFGDGKMAIIDVIDPDTNENLREDGRNIANSFMWMQ